MIQAIDLHLTARPFVVAAAVVLAGLAAAFALASARQQQDGSAARPATSLTAPTLATKPHGRATPWTTAPSARVG